jgi:hypothetical protein
VGHVDLDQSDAEAKREQRDHSQQSSENGAGRVLECVESSDSRMNSDDCASPDFNRRL